MGLLVPGLRVACAAAVLMAVGVLAAAETISEGTYLVGVGKGLIPGTYRAPGGTHCMWYRLSGTGSKDIIEQGGGAFPVVEILPRDKAFRSSRCGTWRMVPTEQDEAEAGRISWSLLNWCSLCWGTR